MKLITDLVDAHYERNEFAFLEYANRIVQHNHGLGRQYTAATVHNHVAAGIEKMDAEKGLCVHCQESIVSADKDHWRQCKKHPYEQGKTEALFTPAIATGASLCGNCVGEIFMRKTQKKTCVFFESVIQ